MNRELDPSAELQKIVGLSEINSVRSKSLLTFIQSLDKIDVLVFIGGPTAGKTRTRNLYAQTLNRQYQFCTWESDGEQSAIREKKIIVEDPQKPFTEVQIDICSEELSYNLARKLRENPDDLLICEFPAVTALLKDGIWEGRDLGAKVLHDLCKGRGEFTNIPNKKIAIVAMIPGINQRLTAAFYRHGIKNAISFEEAQQIALMFGRSGFIDEDHLKMEQADGASLNQIFYLNQVMVELQSYLPNSRPIVSIASIVREFMQNNMVDLISQNIMEPLNEAGLIGYQLDTFSIERQRTFICENDPSLMALGISQSVWDKQTRPYMEKIIREKFDYLINL